MKPTKKVPTFFHEFKNQPIPSIDKESYRLVVGGEVENPLELSLYDLARNFPVVESRRRFYCVNGWSLEALWRGVSVEAVLKGARPIPEAPFLRSVSVGGYEDTSSIRELVHGDALLVTHMDGEPLSPERGFPMRLMLFDRYQFRGVKALTQLAVVREYRPGAWVRYGYTDATIQPFPHLAIDTGEEIMPDECVVDRSTRLQQTR